MNTLAFFSLSALFLSVFSGSFFLSVITALWVLFRFERWFLVILAGFFYELLYGVPDYWIIPSPVFIGSCVLALCGAWFHARLRLSR